MTLTTLKKRCLQLGIFFTIRAILREKDKERGVAPEEGNKEEKNDKNLNLRRELGEVGGVSPVVGKAATGGPVLPWSCLVVWA